METAPKILVVEDDDMMLVFATNILTSLGYPCTGTRTAREAMRLLGSEEGWALLFADVRLSDGEDGVTLAEAALARWPGLRILLTSGDGAPQNALALRDDDQVTFLPKPYRRRDVARALERLLPGAALVG